MNLATKIKPAGFLDLFYNDMSNKRLDSHETSLNLFTLKISNNKFDYYSLVEALINNIVPYALSRQELETYKDSVGTQFTKAVRKLRKHETNDGELGELLLYCFLEAHLNAPKILTKLEIKTSNNDYSKGSDGIHLLKIDDQNFQLVFGESKLNSTFQRGLYEAFGSIHDFITRRDNNINHEIGLINSQLAKESLDETTYKFLRKIIMPSDPEDNANLTCEINKDNAFGIFIGFDLKITEEFKKMTNSNFRKAVRAHINEIIEHELEYIKKKIDDYELFGYSFYIYAVPFTNLDETRKRIIKNLKAADNDF